MESLSSIMKRSNRMKMKRRLKRIAPIMMVTRP